MRKGGQINAKMTKGQAINTAQNLAHAQKV